MVAVPGATSGVTWHLPRAAGRHRGAPSSPSCSWELGCDPALYRQRVPGRFQRCWRDGHPSLHPGSAAPLHVLTALPHFRAVPPPHPTASHPRRPLSRGARPCHQPGAAAAPPCAPAPPEQPGCQIFPVQPPLPLARGGYGAAARMCPGAGTRDGACAERECLGTVRGTGHGGNEAPLCQHLLSYRGTSWLCPGIPALVDPPRLPVGLRRCRDPLGRAPGAADFLSSCHVPGFDSFRLLPALPPSSISSASVTALWQLNSMEP